MKIDRLNPRHWWLLLVSGVIALLAVLVRPFHQSRGRAKQVVLYGHKLGGNLLALYRYIRAHPESGIEVTFLSLDPDYAQKLTDQGESCVSLTSPTSLRVLCAADVLISDHGLHALLPLLYASNLRFVDVWHGIPFKGFDADDFRVQHRYDEVWVASPLMRKIYIERYGFRSERVIITGYARTDVLVASNQDTRAVRQRLGLPVGGRLVLFAPTWKQDDCGRSLFPFGLEARQFLEQLAPVLVENDAYLVLRTHLNSPVPAQLAGERVMCIPYAEQPDTEALLLASDMLVCDWSSIAFDFLLLERPTIFLDTLPPFRKGFSLGAEYRFGPVASKMQELVLLVRQFTGQPADYHRVYGGRSRAVRDQVYAQFADGFAVSRSIDRLADP